MLQKLVSVFGICLLIAAVATAGVPAKKLQAKGPFTVGGPNEKAPAMVVRTMSYHPATTMAVGPGDSVGFACYDYGTNGTPNHNIINFGDGTISIGRMGSEDYSAGGYATRATYFTYFNGTTWTTWSRVEPTRVGWGNIDQFVDGGGIEVVASHVGPKVNVDGSKGAGSWTAVSPTGAKGTTWPKMVAGTGANIYIIGSDGTPDSVFFESSADGGSTWGPSIGLFGGTTGSDADAYDIATDGNNIAVVSGPFLNDVYLRTSSDGGATWSSISKVFDAQNDSGQVAEGVHTPVPDGSVTAIYDASHNLHVFWGAGTWIGDSLKHAPSTYYYALDNQIMHWSQATGVNTVAFPVSDTTIFAKTTNFMPGIDGALVSSPSAGLDASGNLYLVYMEGMNEQNVDSAQFVHLFAAKSADAGAHWGSVDITPGTGIMCDFPSLAKNVGTDLHIVYNSDNVPGNLVQGPQAAPDTITVVRYLKVAASSIPTTGSGTGVTEESNSMPTRYALNQNYPNPFNPSTIISYTLPKAAKVSLKVYNILGQEVATIVNEQKEAGTYYESFNASKLASGVYLYKLQAGSFSESKKMMLVK